ncbi:hypothetical protein BGW38_001271 [Lunasporangiospora selenospora]|uniref:Uncharacterized protein n=1 Tax=Lunasporangiospora selenospora TaxID=979761 RepID=A0A9P6KE77_9FUNG|nr:hypothetical protein BGW38_001271 [Lunasporangiospora selenospora]
MRSLIGAVAFRQSRTRLAPHAQPRLFISSHLHQPSRRYLHAEKVTVIPEAPYNVVLDIDGVLIKSPGHAFETIIALL